MEPADSKKKEAVNMDTAITMTGSGKFHMGLALLVGGCIGSATTDNLGNGFALPVVTCEFGLSVADKGLFSGATYFGMMLTGYAWGFASDTYGRRKVLLLSSGISWLASFCASLAPAFWLLVSLRFLAGATMSGIASTVYAYTAEFLPPKERTKYFSWSGIFVGISFCIIPAGAWLILPLTWSLNLGFVVVTPWRMLCLLNGFFILITFLLTLGLPESPKYLISIDKHDEAIEVLRKVFSINTGRPENEYPVHAIRKTVEDIRTVGIDVRDKLSLWSVLKTMKEQIVPIFGRKHIVSTILSCIIQFSIFASACGFYLWMPDILHNVMNSNGTSPNSTAAICNAVNIALPSSNTTCESEISSTVYVSALVTGGGYCVGYLLIVVLANASNQRALLAGMQLLSGIAAIGLYWATDVISVGISAAVYMIPPELCIILMNSMVSDLYPTHLRSAAVCLSLSVGRSGSSLFGAVIGLLIEFNCSLTIFGLGAMAIGAGLLTLLIPRPDNTIESVTQFDLK